MRYYLWNIKNHHFLQLGMKNIIGRNFNFPDDGKMSGKHCDLSFKERNFMITDLGSKNGTFLNDRPVTEPTVARAFDLIEAGNQSFILLDESVLDIKDSDSFYDRLDKDISESKLKDIKLKLIIFYKRGTRAIEKMLEIDSIKTKYDHQEQIVNQLKDDAKNLQEKLNGVNKQIQDEQHTLDKLNQIFNHAVQEFDSMDETSNYTSTLSAKDE